jgi:uncharacterized protein YdeI (YjbR/CyaY-like superfamily)
MQSVFFQTAEEFRKWLEENYDKKSEIWVKFNKKASGKGGMDRKEALDEVLCFGWIDGIVKSLDEESFIQRYTPRTKKSMWSKINTANIERLIKEGKMKESGLREVELAQADGRWEAAYDSPTNSKVPEDFMEQLKKNKKAEVFFGSLNKTSLFMIAYRLQTAKTRETREKRTKDIIDKLEVGIKL